MCVGVSQTTSACVPVKVAGWKERVGDAGGAGLARDGTRGPTPSHHAAVAVRLARLASAANGAAVRDDAPTRGVHAGAQASARLLRDAGAAPGPARRAGRSQAGGPDARGQARDAWSRRRRRRRRGVDVALREAASGSAATTSLSSPPADRSAESGFRSWAARVASGARVALVTDSTSYLPAGWAQRYDIGVVPVQVVVGGRPYDETHDDQARLVAEALASWQPVTTSRPSPARFLQAYDAAVEAGAQHIVVATLSATMSATYESALLAARGVQRSRGRRRQPHDRDGTRLRRGQRRRGSRGRSVTAKPWPTW